MQNYGLLKRYEIWRNSSTSLAFVNGILSALRRPSITEGAYRAFRDELRNDTELAGTYESKIPRLLEISPHKKIANWQERVARADAQADIFGLPPEKWSSLMYGLWPDGGLKNAKEETHG